MPQEPRALDPTLSACDRFGATLRRWRQHRGLSQAQLALILPVTRDQIAKYEKADRWPDSKAAARLDEFLGAGGEVIALWADGDAERIAAQGKKSAADPSYVAHWTRMLSALASAGNAVGGRGLMDIVSTEVSIISNHGASATGTVAAAYLGAQARWLEFGSWVADNQGDAAKASAWLKHAGELARRAADPVFGAYVLMRRSQRAFEAGQPQQSLDVLMAVEVSGQPPRIRSLLGTRAAQAYAALGDGPAARKSLKAALSDVCGDTVSDLAALELAPHATPNYVRAHEGVCLLTLGEPNGAIRVLEGVLDQWPAAQRLDEGLFRAHLAVAHTLAGALDDGVEQARIALGLGLETGSQRTLRIVRQVLERRPEGAAGYHELVNQWTSAGVEGGS